MIYALFSMGDADAQAGMAAVFIALLQWGLVGLSLPMIVLTSRKLGESPRDRARKRGG